MRQERNLKKYDIIILIVSISIVLLFADCSPNSTMNQRQTSMELWLESAQMNDTKTSKELYEAALSEDTLVIYSVSSRTFETKKSFEKEYPGLTVDIKDIRGNDVVDMVLDNYEKGTYDCDLIICSDCDGSLYKKMIEPGVVYSYFPSDIKEHMKQGHADTELDFLGEAMMFFYNSSIYDAPPIQNIWELTEETYRGKIIMANPLSSFSTFGFFSAILNQSKLLEQAYADYTGDELILPDEMSAGEVFWEKLYQNIVLTNSSDEVLEGIGNQGEDGMLIGIMISSKMRYQKLGYEFEPIYHLNPFSAVYTPNSITIAGGSKNINTAKLFIRYLLGESDGTGAGYVPFSTVGTWSSRMDVADGNEVPLEDIDYVDLDKEFIYNNRDSIIGFCKKLLKGIEN